MPRSAAVRAAFSAATCAANGVPLREPLNPTAPALDHAMTFPCGSVIVMIVLLKVEWMWTTPSATMRLTFRRRAGASAGAAGFSAAGFSAAGSFVFAIDAPSRLLALGWRGLLPRDRPPWSLPRTGIRVG